MFSSEALEVGIGLALMFFLMSLVASALCEVFENITKMRAKFLEKGIGELLEGRSNKDLVERFYKHPMISSLYDGHYMAGSRNLPSYIPRQSFSLAVLDLLRPAQMPSPLSIAALRETAKTIEATNPIKQVLMTTLDSADADLEKVRHTFEEWFDGTMDRVSGWYKRRSGYRLAAVGLLAAVALNVDTLTIAQRLVTDKTLRDAAASAAEQVVKAGPPSTEATQKPPGAGDAPAATDAPKPGAGDPELAEVTASAKAVAEIRDQFLAIGFPTGWSWVSTNHAFLGHVVSLPYPTPQADCSSSPKGVTCKGNWLTGVALSVPGWIVTALAVMLGAPFWFDILNRLMVIRATVKPKEKSPDEASEARAPMDAPPAPPPLQIVEPGSPPEPLPDMESNLVIDAAIAEAAFRPHEWKQPRKTLWSRPDTYEPQRGVM